MQSYRLYEPTPAQMDDFSKRELNGERLGDIARPLSLDPASLKNALFVYGMSLGGEIQPIKLAGQGRIVDQHFLTRREMADLTKRHHNGEHIAALAAEIGVTGESLKQAVLCFVVSYLHDLHSVTRAHDEEAANSLASLGFV